MNKEAKEYGKTIAKANKNYYIFKKTGNQRAKHKADSLYASASLMEIQAKAPKKNIKNTNNKLEIKDSFNPSKSSKNGLFANLFFSKKKPKK